MSMLQRVTRCTAWCQAMEIDLLVIHGMTGPGLMAVRPVIKPQHGYDLSTPLDGQLHGAPCANGSSLNTATGVYYEYHKASAVGNITLGADAGNGRQYAVWTSEDVNGTGHYSHYGYAVLDDANHPNHS